MSPLEKEPPSAGAAEAGGAPGPEKAPRRFDAAMLAGLAAAPLPLLVRLLGLDSIPLRLCILKIALGVSCPTCGASRAMGRLGALDLGSAFALNPGVTLVWLSLVGWALLRITGVWPAIRWARAGAKRNQVRVLALLALLLNWAYVIFKNV